MARPQKDKSAEEGLRFVHVSGPREGETSWLPRLPATIGSNAEHDLVLPGIAPRHAVVFRREDDVVLVDSGSPQGTYLVGHMVQEAVLHHGDVVELGAGGPKLRFEDERERRIAIPVPRASHRMSETMVMRMVHHSSRGFRRMLAAVVVVAALLLGWAYIVNRRVQAEVALLREQMGREQEDRRGFEARVAEERRRADDDRRHLEARLEEERRRAEELGVRLAQAATGEVQVLKDELGATRERIAALETERAAGEKIIKQYGAGVCLIQGSYAFYDNAGRPLRYSLDEAGREVRDADGSPTLGTEGTGAVHSVEYYGTGFLVDARGLILTNRHVAEPWWNDTPATNLQKEGYQPRLVFLRAFFPRHREAFDLKLERRSEKVDLALMAAPLKGRGIPVLPLERSQQRVVAGQPVVVVGYPTGLEAILAKAESSLVRSILESHGTDSEKVTQALSRRGLIRPSTTQGHIGDITGSDIVFDAPSAQGGSGGPVFNKHGQVVAVEYAVLPKFGGNSFGVPISYAIELIEKKPKKPAD